MTIQFTRAQGQVPSGKLADAELHFTEGPLTGLRVIGFTVWSNAQTATGLNVTMPARQYTVNGARRNYCLVRPITEGDRSAEDLIKALIITAYQTYAGIAATV